MFRLAVSERQKYTSRVRAAIYDVNKDKSFLESFEEEMDDFDDNMTRTLDVYLEYLRNFVSMIQVKCKTCFIFFTLNSYFRVIRPYWFQPIRKIYLSKNGILLKLHAHIFQEVKQGQFLTMIFTKRLLSTFINYLMLDAIYWALITLKSGLYQLPSTLEKIISI